MKKIVISANTSWYIYNFRKNTIVKLQDAGMEVIVIAPKDEYSMKLCELGAKFLHLEMNPTSTSLVGEMKVCFLLYKLLKKTDCDLLLNFTPKNNIYGGIAAKLCGIPFINNISGMGRVFVGRSITSLLVSSLYKLTQKFADTVFFQNEDDMRFFIKNSIVCKKHAELLPGSGVDLDFFKSEHIKKDNIFRFLMISRIIREKGIYEFAESAKNLKKFYQDKVEFILAGKIKDDVESEAYSDQIRLWTDCGFIKYIGMVDNVKELIDSVDCVVLPSYYREGTPKSLLEASSMSKPIITTDNIGCREALIDGVTGFLCIPKSPDSLSSAMDNVLRMDPVEISKMGAEGREFMRKKFNESIVIEKYIDAINRSLFKNSFE